MTTDFSLIVLDKIPFYVHITFYFDFYLNLFVCFPIYERDSCDRVRFLFDRGVLDKTLCKQLFRPIGLLFHNFIVRIKQTQLFI